MAIVLLTMAMPLSFLSSCKKDIKDTVEYVFNPETSSTLKKTNVEMFISDSGVTRNKATANTWLIFDKASNPYWFFPDGIYIEQFDSVFNKEVCIKADTAYNYVRRELWELKGNVDMLNLKEDIHIETSQIFFDQQKEIFYSDVFIRITKGESVNTGTGFHSNKDLSYYELRNAGAVIPVETKRRVVEADSIPQDTLIIEN